MKLYSLLLPLLTLSLASATAIPDPAAAPIAVPDANPDYAYSARSPNAVFVARSELEKRDCIPCVKYCCKQSGCNGYLHCDASFCSCDRYDHCHCECRCRYG